MWNLKANMRANRRYLLIQGVRSSVEKAILEFIGVLGWADAAPVFVSEKNGNVVLCVNREGLAKVRAALSLAKDELTILRVSGTLKGLSK
jgi:RNase P/RNase MRP subunit POP5